MKNLIKGNHSLAEKSVTPPAKSLSAMYLVHLGQIFSNLSIVCVIIGMISFISILLQITVFFVLLLGLLCTLGLILLYVPNYMQLFQKSADFLGSITAVVVKIAPYVLIVGIVCAIISIVLLAIDRYNSHMGRIVFSSIILAITVVILICIFTGVIL